MIVTRTPFRITLGGGGTDLPSYYESHGGFIFAAGIDKYMVITMNDKPFDDLIRLKYSESETVSSINDLKHELAREIFRLTEIDKRVDVSSIADVPAGTGLGSSSCFAVGLLHAIHTLKRDHVPLYRLAEEDFIVEKEFLKRPIGKQDPYMAAMGGFTVLDIGRDGVVVPHKANISEEIADEFNSNLLLFFTGATRSADHILREQSTAAAEQKKDVVESMHYIKELGYRILEAMEAGNIDEAGKMFHSHWQHKKKISTKMTNPEFDKVYDAALRAGALGGKVSGAGGGGFWAFYVPERHRKFRQAMRELGLSEMRYRFDFEGSKVLADF